MNWAASVVTSKKFCPFPIARLNTSFPPNWLKAVMVAIPVVPFRPPKIRLNEHIEHPQGTSCCSTPCKAGAERIVAKRRRRGPPAWRASSVVVLINSIGFSSTGSRLGGPRGSAASAPAMACCERSASRCSHCWTLALPPWSWRYRWRRLGREEPRAACPAHGYRDRDWGRSQAGLPIVQRERHASRSTFMLFSHSQSRFSFAD